MPLSRKARVDYTNKNRISNRCKYYSDHYFPKKRVELVENSSPKQGSPPGLEHGKLVRLKNAKDEYAHHNPYLSLEVPRTLRRYTGPGMLFHRTTPRSYAVCPRSHVNRLIVVILLFPRTETWIVQLSKQSERKMGEPYFRN